MQKPGYTETRSKYNLYDMQTYIGKKSWAAYVIPVIKITTKDLICKTACVIQINEPAAYPTLAYLKDWV